MLQVATPPLAGVTEASNGRHFSISELYLDFKAHYKYTEAQIIALPAYCNL
jgi:hypothetical protein